MTATYQNYLDQKLSFALYPKKTITEAIVKEESFREFLRNLTTPKISSHKDVLLVGPHTLKNEYTRATKNIHELTALTFDIDSPQEYSFEQMIELFGGYLGALHSTWSHSEKEPRYRLFLMLKHPIALEHYATVRENFLSKHPELNQIADPACRDPARAFYVFSYPQERAEMARCIVLHGVPVDPSQYLTLKHLPYFETYEPQPLEPKNNEEQRLLEALSALSSDTGYGSGRFYDSNSKPESDYWLAAIWAIASQGWGKEIARQWSKKSKRYSDSGFEQAWNSYNPNHPNKVGIGSLYKRAKELGSHQSLAGLQVNNAKLLQPAQRPFTLLTTNELAALPPTEYLIKGILPSSGLAAIFGPSGSGKTFLVLDLIMAIACQSDWFGHKIKNVPVTYVGLEGKGGINNRIQAWRIKNPDLNPKNLRIILDNFDLMKEGNVVDLAHTINQSRMNQGLIVIDTLNQASPGAEENSSVDMGIILKHLKVLQEMTSGLILIIHHSGKTISQGLRGHSSLKAALDTNIEIVGGDKRSWLLEKSKDGADGKSFGFKLAVQQLGVDRDGDSITSCTVERDHSAIFSKPEPSGKEQKKVLKAIREEIAKVTARRITSEAAISFITKEIINVAPNKRKNRARQLLGTLINGGYLFGELVNDEGWVWLP